MSEKRFLIFVLIVLSIFVFFDIGRRVHTYFLNHSVTISGSNRGINIYSYVNPWRNTGNINRQNDNEIDFNDNSDDSRIYNNYMYRIMMHNWKNPIDDENVHAEIRAIINRNGKLKSYQLTKSSNYPEYDKAAINALLDTSPFQPFLENMRGNERLFTFYFNGSRAGANGFTYRTGTRAPLEISINQAFKRTTHPHIQDIKYARIDCNGSYCYCNVWDKWRPSLTDASKISIDVTINKDLSTTIKNVEKINDTYATERAVEAVKSVKCENYPEQYPRDMKYTFYVEGSLFNR